MTAAITQQSPTLIRKEALDALIEHIEREKFLVRDLGSTLEYVYRMKHEKDIDVYKDMRVIMSGLADNPIDLPVHLRNEDFLCIMVPSVVFTPILSNEAMDWAGLDRRDPYLDIPLFPKSTLLSYALHTWDSYGNKDYMKHNSIGRRRLVEVLRRMPLADIGF